VPLPIEPQHFPAAITGLMRAGFAGANCTIPHKVAAFEVCGTVEESARRAGAVNTLVFRDGRIIGSNTDGWGFLENLRAHGVNPAAQPALILGAGGSARAIGAVLLDLGVRVTLANRTRANGERLARELPGLQVVDWHQREDALADHGLLVNTTSQGMTGYPPLDISLDRAPPGLTVADIVYVPLETPLLAAARARGLRCVEGGACCCIRRSPAFAPGSAPNRWWMTHCAASSQRICCRREGHRPDRRDGHGQVHRRRRVPPRRHPGIRR